MNRSTLQVALGLLMVLTVGCGPRQSTNPPPPNRDGGPDFAGVGLPCPTPPKDSDEDGISDHAEARPELNGAAPSSATAGSRPDRRDPRIVGPG